MAHRAQFDYVYSLKQRFPDFFESKRVLEIGSLNINGSIRQFFLNCAYLGVDLGFGPDVNLIARGEDLGFPAMFDVTCSCECFEHNPGWAASFSNMVRMTAPGGLVFFTCATAGREEHGTSRSHPGTSPFTSNNDYYRNLTEFDFQPLLEDHFVEYKFETNRESKDLYFYGIKK